MSSKHSNKKLLVGLVLVVLLVGVGIVFADGPVEQVVVTYEDALPFLNEAVITDFAGTSFATDEDGTPACEDWCSNLNCVVPSERALPANEAIRWRHGFECVDLEGASQTVCESSEESFCERTRSATEVVSMSSASPWSYLRGLPARVGRTWVVNSLALAQFRLVGMPTREIEKAVVSFEGINTDEIGGACSSAIFKIDLLSYTLSYTWGKWGYWNYTRDYVVLDAIYEVSAHYLQAVTEEDGHVPTLGFRLSNEQIPPLEEAIARAQPTSPYYNSNWSLFLRVTLVNPPEVGDCVLKFNRALLTVIPK